MRIDPRITRIEALAVYLVMLAHARGWRHER